MAHGINHTHRHTVPPGIRAAMIALVLLLQGVCSVPAYCQSTVSDEYLVKSAFLFNFAKFVKWPDNAFADDKAPLVFCVLGEDPFGSRLDLLEKKTINGRPVAIRRIENLAQLGHCQVLYVSSSEGSNVRQILAGVKGRPVLTVSDIPGFACNGGIIGLFKFQSKVRFAIDPCAATENGLKISSQLMKLSHICGGE